VLTLYGIGSLVGIQLGGRLSDDHPWTTMYSALAAIVLVLATLGLAGSIPPVTLVVPFVLGTVVFAAATPLNARVFQLAGPAPTLAGAAATSAFNVGNTAGPWLGGLVISAGWGFRAPALVGAVLAAAALALAVLSRAWDARRLGKPELADAPADPARCPG
jgi:DHA1 family chloramphenicol resistance protein-like MFS transporter